ncbi:MAG: hypothetical protein NTV93_21220 [Verrucomicrobia bacterium]|nr:hypothetical protein [Verrucomicrobiota bacterium]
MNLSHLKTTLLIVTCTLVFTRALGEDVSDILNQISSEKTETNRAVVNTVPKQAATVLEPAGLSLKNMPASQGNETDKQLSDRVLEQLNKSSHQSSNPSMKYVDTLSKPSGEPSLRFQRLFFNATDPSKNFLVDIPIDESGKMETYCRKVKVANTMILDKYLLEKLTANGDLSGPSKDQLNISAGHFKVIKRYYTKFSEWRNTAKKNNIGRFAKWFDGRPIEGDSINQDWSNFDSAGFSWNGSIASMFYFESLSSPTFISEGDADAIYTTLLPVVETMQRDAPSMMKRLIDNQKRRKDNINSLFN